MDKSLIENQKMDVQVLADFVSRVNAKLLHNQELSKDDSYLLAHLASIMHIHHLHKVIREHYSTKK